MSKVCEATAAYSFSVLLCGNGKARAIDTDNLDRIMKASKILNNVFDNFKQIDVNASFNKIGKIEKT